MFHKKYHISYQIVSIDAYIDSVLDKKEKISQNCLTLLIYNIIYDLCKHTFSALFSQLDFSCRLVRAKPFIRVHCMIQISKTLKLGFKTLRFYDIFIFKKQFCTFMTKKICKHKILKKEEKYDFMYISDILLLL